MDNMPFHIQYYVIPILTFFVLLSYYIIISMNKIILFINYIINVKQED